MRYNGRAQRPSPTQSSSTQPKPKPKPKQSNQPANAMRIETASIERGSKCVTTGGHSGPPLRRVRQRNQNQNQSNLTSQPTRCALKQHPSKELQNALPREGAAALPYAEFVNATKTNATQPASQRDAHSNSIHRKSFKMRYHRRTQRPPLRRVGQSKQNQSNQTSQVTRCGVECGMGVPQGVPKEALRYKKTKRPPA